MHFYKVISKWRFTFLSDAFGRKDKFAFLESLTPQDESLYNNDYLIQFSLSV
jgi:hypothetical protein